MATFAEYILNEPDFIKKVEVASYLKKKNNIFFNTQVILKAEIAREFIDCMKIDVDRNFVLSACLMFDCLKIESPEELIRLEKSQDEYKDYLLSLGFDEKFCKVCNEHSRVGHDPNEKREKESDILELVDQFGGLIMNRSDRLAFTVPEALEILMNRNLKDVNNVYKDLFAEFVDIMEEMDSTKVGLLSRFQTNMNCVKRHDTPDAVRVLYETLERNEKAFAKREAELRMGGDLLEELRKARAKLRYYETAPILPGLETDYNSQSEDKI